MRKATNPAVGSHERETVNLVICGAGTWETISTNQSELGCSIRPYHSKGRFCFCLHGKQARLDFFVTGQRRLEFDSDRNLFTRGWGLVVNVHALRKCGNETIWAECSRMDCHLGVYPDHLRIGNLGVRHFAVVDDVAGEGVLVAGHVHT